MTIVYRRAQHAAHYSYDHSEKGHDLEQWDVAMSGFDAPWPDGVPHNAERHSGYIDRATGEQHVVFVRVAPLTETCPRCEGLR